MYMYMTVYLFLLFPFPSPFSPLSLPPPSPCHTKHLVEKSWYMVLETFILLAGFHEDMQVGFVATITFLFVVKAFHWLIEERINYVRGIIITVQCMEVCNSLSLPLFLPSLPPSLSPFIPPSLPPSISLSLSPQMERSPLITWTFHLRAEAILLLLATVDILYMCHSWNSLRTKGASVLIVFGLEVTYTIAHLLTHM